MVLNILIMYPFNFMGFLFTWNISLCVSQLYNFYILHDCNNFPTLTDSSDIHPMQDSSHMSFLRIYIDTVTVSFDD